MMERFCFVLPLRHGMGPEYDRVHAALPAEVHQQLAAAGFRDYTIFREGETVVGYARCDPDIETVLAKQKQLSEVLRPVADIAAGPLRILPPVWRLESPEDDVKSASEYPREEMESKNA
jgi:L-rhamnose mutarotase